MKNWFSGKFSGEEGYMGGLECTKNTGKTEFWIMSILAHVVFGMEQNTIAP